MGSSHDNYILSTTNFYNEFFLFFRRAFFALKYAIGTTALQ